MLRSSSIVLVFGLVCTMSMPIPSHASGATALDEGSPRVLSGTLFGGSHTSSANGVGVAGDWALYLHGSTAHILSVADPSAPVHVSETYIPGANHAGQGDGFVVVLTEGSFSQYVLYPSGDLIETGGIGATNVLDSTTGGEGLGGAFFHMVEPSRYAFFTGSPSSPFGGSVTLPVTDASRIAADEDGVYILTESDVLLVGEVASFVATLPVVGDDIAAHDGVVYVFGDGPTQIVDARDLANPMIVGTLPAFTRGDVADGFGHFGSSLYDLTDPLTPVLVAEQVNYASSYGSRAIAGDLFVFGSGYGHAEAQLLVSTLGARSSPIPLATVEPGGAVIRRIVRQGATLAVETNSEWFAYDVADPSAPQLRTTLELEKPRSALSDDHAFILDGSILRVFDLVSFAEVAALPLDPDADKQHAALRGDALYLADRTCSFTVVNVSTPGSPFVVATGATLSYATDPSLYVDGARLYCESSMWSVADPFNPVHIGSVPSYGFFRKRARGDLFASMWSLYEGDETFGHPYEFHLVLSDVSDPGVVTEFADLIMPGELSPSDVALTADRAWVAVRSGLHVFDTADPTAPVHLATLGEATRVIAFDDLVITANSRSVSLYPAEEVVSVPDAPAGARLVAGPNPFRSGVTISGARGERVTILDVAGRVVGEVTIEGVTATWDGRDRRGQSVAPGVYFARDERGLAVRLTRVR